jgi:hypothetical protein
MENIEMLALWNQFAEEATMVQIRQRQSYAGLHSTTKTPEEVKS